MRSKIILRTGIRLIHRVLPYISKLLHKEAFEFQCSDAQLGLHAGPLWWLCRGFLFGFPLRKELSLSLPVSIVFRVLLCMVFRLHFIVGWIFCHHVDAALSSTSVDCFLHLPSLYFDSYLSNPCKFQSMTRPTDSISRCRKSHRALRSRT